jgi:hypothetical protein
MSTSAPTHLSDADLIAAVSRFAVAERGAKVQLIAHLAEFDARDLYLREGHSSLFAYCCDVLLLSEHESYSRIEAARASRRFPRVLEALADGLINLTTIRLLVPRLTEANHRELLAAASHLKKRDVEQLIADRFPLPPLAPSIRKVPVRRIRVAEVEWSRLGNVETCSGIETRERISEAPSFVAPRPAIVVPRAPDRYEIRFTATAATRDKLRLAQDLLRHAIPSGDPAEIFDRALGLLLAEVTRRKAAEVAVPSKDTRRRQTGSRHIPAEVRRAVWRRDEARCAFQAANGRRCSARALLEFHHVDPYALGGPATAENIQLRCRAHNRYEAQLVFGPPPISAQR